MEFIGFTECFRILNNNANGVIALTSIIALFIATNTIISAKKDSRKQIIVEKFEEIYNLIYVLLPEYLLFFQLYKTLEGHHNQDYPLEQRQGFLETYRSELKQVKSIVNVDDLFNKTSKLSVLSNAYLDKDLKNEILGYSKLFEMIIIVSTQQQMIYKYTQFPNGFPDYENVHIFAGEISRKLIEKINLGGENVDKKIFNEYFKNEFQEKLGLKNNLE